MDRWHYIPNAHRTLFSLIRLTPQGFKYEGENEHTLITKNGVTVFTCRPEREVPGGITKAELDDDSFVPPLIMLDQACFMLPDNVRIPECNLVAPPPRGDIQPHHEVHTISLVNRLGRVQIQNLCDAHKRFAHADIRKVGFVLGIRLRESLTAEIMLCAHCACAKITSAPKGTPRA